jgi:hypothetical protein
VPKDEHIAVLRRGYSRLVGIDEDGAISRVKLLHRELIAPLIGKHAGRIVC